MSVTRLLLILRARWWQAAIVFLLSIGIAIGVSLVIEKQYEATATVVLDSKPDPVALYTGVANPIYIATQVEIIGSARVAERVVKSLRLNENSQLRQSWLEATGGNGSFEVWISDSIRRGISVRPALQTSVIGISYKASDPRFAAALANAFAQAYLETSVELRVNPARQHNEFFEKRVQDARNVIETAQSRYSSFQRSNGIVASDERIDIETARLNELSSQLTAMQSVMAESSSRESAARTSADRLNEVMNNPSVLGIKSDLSRQEVRLQELNSKLGESHPQVIELKASVVELRQKLDVETKRATGSVSVTSTINKSREAQLRNQLDNQRQKVLKLKAVRDEGLILARELESAQRAYDAVSARATQSGLESQFIQPGANLLTSAHAPLEHSSPRIFINTVLGILVGLILASGIVLALEMVDRRVRGPEDIAAILNVSVLGVLPKPNADRKNTSGYRALIPRRIIGQLAAPGKV